MPGRKYGLADVRASYPPAKREDELENEVAYFLIYRPVSIWLTPLFLRLRLPPTAVTALSLVLALAMPAAAAALGAGAYLAVGCLTITFHVMDCVDGNIARTTGRTSAPGALFDGFAGHVFWVMYFAALGILVQRQGSGFWAEHGLHLALALILLVMLHRELRDAYSRFYDAEITAIGGGTANGSWAMRVFISLEGFYGFAVLVAGALGRLPELLAATGVYVAVIFAGAVALTFSSACRRPPPESWHGR